MCVAKKVGQARAAVFVWGQSLRQRPEKRLERMLVNHSLDTTAGTVVTNTNTSVLQQGALQHIVV